MKQFFLVASLMLVSVVGNAHPGGHELICKSAKNSGSKQALAIHLRRSNGTGWFAPSITVTLNGKKFQMTTPDENKSYGGTIHDSPLGVVMVTVDNWEQKPGAITGAFSVTAVPGTVRAFDSEGKPAVWKLENEKDECYDTNGRAKFRGLFKGTLNQGMSEVPLEPQLMDCQLGYDSGMAC